MTPTRKKMGRPLNPKWAEYDAQLGTVPDRIIAEGVGVSQTIVSRHRRNLGIPSFRPYKANRIRTVPLTGRTP